MKQFNFKGQFEKVVLLFTCLLLVLFPMVPVMADEDIEAPRPGLDKADENDHVRPGREDENGNGSPNRKLGWDEIRKGDATSEKEYGGTETGIGESIDDVGDSGTEIDIGDTDSDGDDTRIEIDIGDIDGDEVDTGIGTDINETDGNEGNIGTGTVLPRYGEGIPGYGSDYPGYFEGIPGYGSDYPGYFEGIPGYGLDYPGYFEGIPDGLGYLAGYGEDYPGYAGIYPGYMPLIPPEILWSQTRLGYKQFGDAYFGESGSDEVGVASKVADTLISSADNFIDIMGFSKIDQLNFRTGVGLGKTALSLPFAAMAPWLGPSFEAGVDAFGLTTQTILTGAEWYKWSKDASIASTIKNSSLLTQGKDMAKGMWQTVKTNPLMKGTGILAGVSFIGNTLETVHHANSGNTLDAWGSGLGAAGDALLVGAAFGGPAAPFLATGALLLTGISLGIRYREQLGAAWNATKSFAGDVAEATWGFAGDVVNGATDFVSDGINTVYNGAGNLIEGAGSALATGMENIASNIGSGMQPRVLGAGVELVGSTVANATQNVATNVGNAVKDVGTTVSNTVDSIGKGIGDGMKSIGKGISNFLGGSK